MHTNDYTGIGPGILFQEGLDNGESLVIFVRDGKNDFKVGVFMAEGRFEIFE